MAQPINIEPTVASLINSYRNLAQLWHQRAEYLMSEADAYGTYMAIKSAIECETKASRLEQRHVRFS